MSECKLVSFNSGSGIIVSSRYLRTNSMRFCDLREMRFSEERIVARSLASAVSVTFGIMASESDDMGVSEFMIS